MNADFLIKYQFNPVIVIECWGLTGSKKYNSNRISKERIYQSLTNWQYIAIETHEVDNIRKLRDRLQRELNRLLGYKVAREPFSA